MQAPPPPGDGPAGGPADAPADVVVVGAGIAGLACAERLRGAGLSSLVLESGPRPGGRVRTEEFAGARVECGAHFFNDRYAAVHRLVRAAGLVDEVTPLAAGFLTAVWRAGRWHHLDYTSRRSILRYPAVTTGQKASLLRVVAATAPLARRMRFYDLASAAALDARVPADLIDPDVLRYQLLPIYQAFCGYHADEMSLPMVALGTRFRFGTPCTLPGGLGRLTDALAERHRVRCGVAVEAVRVAAGGGVVVEARRADGGTEVHRARAAVLAVPPHVALALWPGADAATRRFLGAQHYSPFVLAYLQTRVAYAPRAPGGAPVFMDVIPLGERDGVLEHVYYGAHDAAADGGVVLVGAYPDAAAAEPDDAALADRLQAELEALRPALRGQVTARHIVRWAAKVPIHRPGAARALADFRAGLVPGPVQLAGDYLFGPVLEGAALAGEAAADRVGAHLAGPAAAAGAAGRVRAAWRSERYDRTRARVYDACVEHEWLGRPAARAMWGVAGRHVYGPAEALADLPAGAAVLDVPCGGGVAFRGLPAGRPVRYVGVDVSPGQLDRARQRAERRALPQVTLVEADVGRLPFDDGTFDLCLSLNGLNAVDDPTGALAEIARCLRPGGRLVGTTLVTGAGARYDRLIRYWQRIDGFGPVGTAGDVGRWLDAAGLVGAELERSGAVVCFRATRPQGG